MTTTSRAAQIFADALNVKFADQPSYATNHFGVQAGRKYDRITQAQESGDSMSVHAFVERATGAVLKAAGWSAPARGVRFASVEAAVEAADLHGSYLYKR